MFVSKVGGGCLRHCAALFDSPSGGLSMKPFESIKVIDLTHVIAGPFCTHQLAMLGAQVTKIESPSEPDMMRISGPDFGLSEHGLGVHFLSQNAGKRSIALDIKHPEGRQVFLKLIENADVLIENFRASVMSSLNLSYETLLTHNPRLIYCSMSGFGHTGPKANHPAYDNVIQAYSGLMMASGTAQTGPVKIGPPVLDYATGTNAALAIASALFRRQLTDKGEHIDVAMLDSALMLMSSTVTETLGTQCAPQPPGNSSASNAGYGLYQVKDGMIMLGAYTPKQLSDLWRALEQTAMAERVRSWSYQQIHDACEEQRAILARLLADRSAQDLENVCNQYGVPAARVRSLEESLQSPQVESREVIQSVAHPLKPKEQLRVPVAAFSYQSDGPTPESPPPMHAQHTGEILAELGFAAEKIAELEELDVISIG